MSLVLYHAEPLANSLKSLIPLHEKALGFESRYVDLQRFEQHEPWFVAINPEGQVPVLVHDGESVNHTTVINEYLEDAFPEATPLRPADPLGRARMRAWNKFVDEQVMNFVSIHGWHRRIRLIAQKFTDTEFEAYLERIPLVEQRNKWRTAREGFDEAELANATRKVTLAVERGEAALAESPWLVGDDYSLADVNLFAMCSISLGRLFPELAERSRYPHFWDWHERMLARPAVQSAMAGPDRTDPAIRVAVEQARPR